MNYYVGFDPGGDKAFGWAVLSNEGGIKASGTCSSAGDALRGAANATLKGQVAAFAIDAPLYWVNSGDRMVDRIVRKMVCDAGGASGTVGHVNSLRGACLVQGILILRRAAKTWPDAEISEAHPKALIATNRFAKNPVAKKFRTDLRKLDKELHEKPHELDAAVAAYTACALANESEGWCDLLEREKEEQRRLWPAGKLKISYWFPRPEFVLG